MSTADELIKEMRRRASERLQKLRDNLNESRNPIYAEQTITSLELLDGVVIAQVGLKNLLINREDDSGSPFSVVKYNIIGDGGYGCINCAVYKGKWELQENKGQSRLSADAVQVVKGITKKIGHLRFY